jgi:hypothetical protein
MKFITSVWILHFKDHFAILPVTCFKNTENMETSGKKTKCRIQETLGGKRRKGQVNEQVIRVGGEWEAG